MIIAYTYSLNTQLIIILSKMGGCVGNEKTTK